MDKEKMPKQSDWQQAAKLALYFHLQSKHDHQ
jgi:hypothetical protein